MQNFSCITWGGTAVPGLCNSQPSLYGTCNKSALYHPKTKFHPCEKPGRQQQPATRGDETFGVKPNDDACSRVSTWLGAWSTDGWSARLGGKSVGTEERPQGQGSETSIPVLICHQVIIDWGSIAQSHWASGCFIFILLLHKLKRLNPIHSDGPRSYYGLH